jgi:hypothetical protein
MNWPVRFLLVVSGTVGGGGPLAGQVHPYVGRAYSYADHLLPAESYFANPDWHHAYYRAVRDALCAGLSDEPLARVLVMPSFLPEYVLAVQRKGAGYSLTYRVCEPSVWETHEGHLPVRVHTTTVPLRPAVATAITQLFTAAVAQTRYPAGDSGDGLDGTRYTFTTYERTVGFRSGERWSPPAGTRLRALVEVQATLRQLALNPTNGLLQQRLLQQAQQLLPRLT